MSLLSNIFIQIIEANLFIRALFCGYPIVISLFARPSVLLSVRDGLSGAYLLSPWPNMAHTCTSPTVPLCQRCAVNLNYFSRSMVKVIEETKSLSGEYRLSPWSSLVHTSLTLCLWPLDVQRPWINFVGHGHIGHYKNPFFSEHTCIYFQLIPIWLILKINKAYQ